MSVRKKIDTKIGADYSCATEYGEIPKRAILESIL
jgi:hypothetical protein